MALSNYTELVASVKAWVHRNDLDSVIPDFVKLAEVRIAQDLNMQSVAKETSFSTVADQKAYDIPSDMVSLERMWLTSDGIDYPMNGVSADHVALENTTTYRPAYYYVESGKIKLSPIPDKVYTVNLSYLGRLNLQTDSTNLVMTNHPNIYLFATLIEAYQHIGGSGAATKLQLAEQRYKQAIGEANKAEDFNDQALLVSELAGLIGSHRRDINSL